jgi:S-methylmethionine-dependent homocysteine/selenocysteine methylase
MDISTLLDEQKLILMEAAIVEPLRRNESVTLHPSLVHAPLIYDAVGKALLGKLYEDYMNVAAVARLPFLMGTPTWRTNHERVHESRLGVGINVDAVRFLQEARDSERRSNTVVQIGGIIGCKNDCYRPQEGLSAADAERFHAWQISELARGGVDFLIAETLPCIDEAIGIARAMEKTERPYFISFVIDREGKVLDGTSLFEAINVVDAATERGPLGYMVNCAYPAFLRAAEQPPELFKRLVGFLANASSLDHCDLDGSESLQMESVAEWGEEMLALHRKHGIKILGGCCGTGVEHLKYIVSH